MSCGEPLTTEELLRQGWKAPKAKQYVPRPYPQWVDENDKLKAINVELLAACKAMEAICNLWLPTETSIEHRDEAIALHSARTRLLNAIAKAEEKQ